MQELLEDFDLDDVFDLFRESCLYWQSAFVRWEDTVVHSFYHRNAQILVAFAHLLADILIEIIVCSVENRESLLVVRCEFHRASNCELTNSSDGSALLHDERCLNVH